MNCLQNKDTLNREIAGIIEAANYFKQKNGTIITIEDEKELKQDILKMVKLLTLLNGYFSYYIDY